MISRLSVLLLLALHRVSAQQTTASCLPGFEWSLNQLAQSPCLVAAYLGYQCSPNSTFNVPPVSPGQQYLPPSGQQANQCECSSVYYSLLSACALCQGSSLGDFTSWSQSCPHDSISMGTYPLATPNGTSIQPWAYLPLKDGAFDVQEAGRNATGNPSFGTSTTTLSKGAIVGVAVGSSLALLLVAVALWVFWRAKNMKTHVPIGSESYSTDHSGLRYDKVEGPPRRPYHWLPQRTPKVVSYRPGLNFDLNTGQRGDLLELSSSHKRSKNQISSKDYSPSPAFASRTSLESSTKLSKKRDTPAASHDAPPLPRIFSRAKEVRSRPDNRFDLAAEDGNRPSAERSREPSPSRNTRPVLDM